jgi:general secretion pathway protein L
MTRLLLATDDGLVPIGPEGEGAAIGVIPGDDVALHRVRLAAGGEKARAVEARERAAELAAAPADALHVAVGPVDEEGEAWLGIVARAAMEAHLDRFRAAGIEPAALVPAALLLPPATDERPEAALLAPTLLVRGGRFAGAIEEELAAAVGADPAEARPLAERAPALALPPELDLLQGPFANRPAWWRARWFRWGAIALLALLLLLAAVPLAMERVHHGLEARAFDLATMALAERVLEKKPESAEAAASALAAARAKVRSTDVAERLAQLLLMVEPIPGARIESLKVSGGNLLVRLGGPADAVNQVAQAIAGGAFLSRQAGDEIRIGARKPPPLPEAPAEARLARAQMDAEVVARARRAGSGPAPARLARALAQAGIAAPVTPAAGGGATVAVEAVRADVWLPLLARLEADGLAIAALDVRRNDDPSLNVSLEVR